MADSKITALTSIGTITDPAVDPLVIVDVSDTSMAATGTTKKVTLNNLLACSPTATLASATITGNLTVDTNTFAVDASTNRVFVGTAPISTAYPFYVTRGGTAGSIAQFTDGTAQTLTIDSAAGGLIVGNANNGYLEFVANGLAQYRIAPLGVFSWFDGAGGTRMTLNSTGLGVGGSPTARFEVFSGFIKNTATTGSAQIIAGNTGGVFTLAKDSSTGGNFTGTAYASVLYSDGAYPVCIFSNGSERMRIDSAGNVGVGVTSPAYKVHSVVTSGFAGRFNSSTAVAGGILAGNSVGDLIVGVDASGNGRITADTSKYLGLGSGGINDRVILDASGNLGVGVSTFGTSAAKVLGLANATAPSTSPAGMGQLYVEAGALKYRGSSGTVTTIANA